MAATEKSASRPAGGSRNRGEFYVWFTAAAVTVTFAMLAVLIVVVLVNGLGFFWLSPLAVAELKDGARVMGEVVRREDIPGGTGRRLQFKIGNRDMYGRDFRWVNEQDIAALGHPPDAVLLERQEFGNFYGFLTHVTWAQKPSPEARTPWARLEAALDAVEGERNELEAFKGELNDLSRRMERMRLAILQLRRQGKTENGPRIAGQQEELDALQGQFMKTSRRQETFLAGLRGITATFRDVSGKEKTIPVLDIVRAARPNTLSVWGKLGIYLAKVGELLTGEPREANTEGGLFPAIFGTVMMVIIMSLFCIPLGVVAAVYLREYAREGLLVRTVRVAVYNLAGVPSIVYGVFGLGFFVYGVGGGIDRVFFSEQLPAPTFGTGGILWASLTLALLTVPVVIVTTEEALASIPRGLREGSLALGATKFQTLLRVLLPMATPGIMTGLILAMARAAGEVAPLMITGVVKLAPALPLDGNFPFLHLDRKFMHLGFHIYDVGFQSPNVEAAKPMVYITTLLLVLIVIALSLAAIFLRNYMRRRYQTGTF